MSGNRLRRSGTLAAAVTLALWGSMGATPVWAINPSDFGHVVADQTANVNDAGGLTIKGAQTTFGDSSALAADLQLDDRHDGAITPGEFPRSGSGRGDVSVLFRWFGVDSNIQPHYIGGAPAISFGQSQEKLLSEGDRAALQTAFNKAFAKTVTEETPQGDFAKLQWDVNDPIVKKIVEDPVLFKEFFDNSLSFYVRQQDSSFRLKPTYNKVNISKDSIWRPMDGTMGAALLMKGGIWTGNCSFHEDGSVDSSWFHMKEPDDAIHKTYLSDQFIYAGTLKMEENAVVDLSYRNTSGDDPMVKYLDLESGYYLDPDTDDALRNLGRTLYADKAELAEGTAFRLGVDVATGPPTISDQGVVMRFSGGNIDRVFLKEVATAGGADGSKTTVNIQLGWVPYINEKGTLKAGQGIVDSWQNAPFTQSGDKVPIIFGVLKGGENLNVVGQSSFADGIFSKFEITPEVVQMENGVGTVEGIGADKHWVWTPAEGFFQSEDDPNKYEGSAWALKGFTFVASDISESGMAAADDAIVMQNLWKNVSGNLFRRSGGLHALAVRPEAAADRENVWTDMWHGRYGSTSGYGRSLTQSYNGLQAGYDKLLDKRIAGGKVYTGFFVTQEKGKSTTVSGSGEQDALGVGLYTSWAGARGHYLDLGVQAAKLGSDFAFYDTNGRITGANSTWAYGLGAQYGCRKIYGSGFFLEPSAALFVGHTQASAYQFSNKLKLAQSSGSSVTASLGLQLGQQLRQGEIYGGAAYYHQSGSGTSLDMIYGDNRRSVLMPDGKDKWWEFGLGGRIKISPTGSFHLDYYKTTGSSVGNEWRLNGGFEWYWGGASAGVRAEKSHDRRQQELTAKNMPAAAGLMSAEPAAGMEQQRDAAVHKNMAAGRQREQYAAEQVVQSSGAGEDNSRTVHADGGIAAVPSGGTDEEGLGEFAMGPLTVEAARPDWEKNLSPGSVTVINTEEFKGEQKDLPDLLERVPGLFVQRINGTGHYTVARVRGATGAQVNVYIDGVLANLNGDAAVNLSIVPVENVERIEVYRGYVPARFVGAPLGGVINIVTKKPQQAGGKITQGVRSYGGYNGSYEFTAPLGSGSLMAAFNRNIWEGAFPFQIENRYYEKKELKRYGNGYQNSDALLQWQDGKWQVKASWKKTREEVPSSISSQMMNTPSWEEYFDRLNTRYKPVYLTVESRELQVGMRDTVGNLDWGWRLHYLNSKKSFLDVSLMEKYDPENPSSGVAPGLYPLPGEVFSDYDSKKWGGNFNAAFKMGDNHLLELNTNLEWEKMQANGSHWDYYDGIAGKYYGRAYIHKYNNKEYHITLQDTIVLDKAASFKLTPILRADKVAMETMSDADQSWQYSGGLALTKRFNDHWNVKSTWGTYNRHPNFYEIFGDGATIRPNTSIMNAWELAGRGTWETGTQFEFGVNWTGRALKADTDVILTWFQRDAKDMLVLSIPPMEGAHASYLAMDAAAICGLELSSTMKWDRLSLDTSATWTRARYKGQHETKWEGYYGKPLPYTPDWLLNMRLNYSFPGDRLNVFAEYNYTSEYNTDIYNYQAASCRVKALSTVDLGFKYKLRKDLRLTCGVNDIFNKGYENLTLRNENQPYPVMGRNYYATVEYSF